MRSESRRVRTLLSPLGLLLLATIAVPAAIFFVYSFFTFSRFERQAGLHADNYTIIFTEPLYRKLALNSLLIAGPTTAISVVAGYLLAYYLAVRARRSKIPILALVVVSMLASYLARIYAWRILLGHTGVINSFFLWAGITNQPTDLFLFTRVSVVLAMVHIFLPITTLVLYASLSGIPSDLRESARDLGASGFTTFRRITLPLTGHGLLFALMLTFFLSAGDYVTPVVLGGQGSATFGTAIADQLRLRGNYGLGGALGFVMVAAFAAVFVFVRLGMKRLRLLPSTHGAGA